MILHDCRIDSKFVGGKSHDLLRDYARVSRSSRCPVCGKPDWCLIARDGSGDAICQRLESAKRRGDAGWFHPGRGFKTPTPPAVTFGGSTPGKSTKRAKPQTKVNYLAYWQRWSKPATDLDLDRLASWLRLPREAIDGTFGPAIRYGPCAALNLHSPEPAFGLPESDGDGSIIGYNCRAIDDAKRSVGNRGAAVPASFRADVVPGPGQFIPLPEGHSNVIAMFTAGVTAIGRPSNLAGAKIIAKILAEVDPDVPIIVIGDNDKVNPTTGKRPGEFGAEEFATLLAKALDRPVYWAMSPEGHKDVRDFLTATVESGATWAEAGISLNKHLLATKRKVCPIDRGDLPRASKAAKVRRAKAKESGTVAREWPWQYLDSDPQWVTYLAMDMAGLQEHDNTLMRGRNCGCSRGLKERADGKKRGHMRTCCRNLTNCDYCAARYRSLEAEYIGELLQQCPEVYRWTGPYKKQAAAAQARVVYAGGSYVRIRTEGGEKATIYSNRPFAGAEQLPGSTEAIINAMRDVANAGAPKGKHPITYSDAWRRKKREKGKYEIDKTVDRLAAAGVSAIVFREALRTCGIKARDFKEFSHGADLAFFYELDEVKQKNLVDWLLFARDCDCKVQQCPGWDRTLKTGPFESVQWERPPRPPTEEAGAGATKASSQRYNGKTTNSTNTDGRNDGEFGIFW